MKQMLNLLFPFFSYLIYNYNKKTAISAADFNKVKYKFYDEYGRLTKIVSGGKTLEYIYNRNNQIRQQIINGTIIEFTYSKYGQLKSKRMIENNKTAEKKGIKK